MASSSTSSKPSIGILSIGDMGMGIAKLLLAHDYEVLTVSAGRSQHTIDRIKAANIMDAGSDEDLLAKADIILSIVPPRDALATAKRIADVCSSAAKARKDRKGDGYTEAIFIDLNAISPRTVRKIYSLFNVSPIASPVLSPAPSTPGLAKRLTRTLSMAAPVQEENSDPPAPPPITIKFLDGGIIGSPPTKEKSKAKDDAAGTENQDTDSSWKKPSIPLSGPHESLLPPHLLSTLSMKFVSTRIGTASALKACFASLTKGFTALSILSYTTAATCGVLPELKSHLDSYMPGLAERAEKGMTGMPPKAYRWVDEMREIGRTFRSSGGMKMGGDVFEGISEVYRFVAEDTELGAERVGKRKRGTTVEDVAECMEEGVQKKMHKGEGKDEKLELAWRGSWGL